MPELLFSCQDLTKVFDTRSLFDGLSFGIEEGDHIGVVGPNGSGKSTLLRILAGLEPPSSGTLAVRKRLRVGYVPQDPVFAPDATVRSVLAGAFAESTLEERDAEGRIAVAMGKAGFEDDSAAAATLSGGWKKRLAVARALVALPDLLLLDEPTNHLDVDGILWLEELLPRESEAFVAVSHDRYFLEAVAARVIELNRVFPSGLLDVKGRYSQYLATKDSLLAGQAAYQDSLRNRVRGELDWLSRKARARRRKSQARIGEAGRLQGELADLDERSRSGSAAIEFAGTERRSKRLLAARGLTKSYSGRRLIDGLDVLLTPGLRLGLLGANGSGKTTLLRLLSGLEAPDAGTVERADGVKVVIFDQHRSRLDPALSLRRTLAPSGDQVVHGERAVHVASWARRFLFRAEQLDMPVAKLSGGEQARVLIAKLMLEPADVLLLDEPTNDLDIPTLEVLEESLLEFPGALVLITHDRYLLDRVSTQLLALDGNGSVVPYADYAQWEIGQEAKVAAKPSKAAGGTMAARSGKNAAASGSNAAQPKKLGYLDQREREQIEARIVEAERTRDERAESAADPKIAADHATLSRRFAELAEAQAEVDALYVRWAELESKLNSR